MRLLFLTNERGMRGGERQVRLLAGELAKEGWEVALGIPAGAALARDWPGPVFPIPMANALDLRGVWGIRGASRRFQPDLAHAFTARAHALAHAAGVRPLVVTRAVAFTAGKGWGGGAKYRRGVDRFIAISQAVMRALEDAGADPKRVRIVAPGVPLVDPDREGGAILRAEMLPGAQFVVAGLGALAREKGFDIAIAALATMPGAALLLAGEGPERAALESLASQSGVRVAFLGQVERIAPVLGAADAFVMPSRSEGFGMALVEAMGAGLPVVASARGGIPEIVTEGVDGLVVEGEKPELLGRALERLRNEPQLARQLGERARARARQFAPKTMAERTRAVYGEALESRAVD